jgi:excisionase family DNA binding protein
MTIESREMLVSDGQVTVNEASDLTKLSRSYLYQLMERQELAYVKLGKRRFIPRKSLIALMANAVVSA